MELLKSSFVRQGRCASSLFHLFQLESRGRLQHTEGTSLIHLLFLSIPTPTSFSWLNTLHNDSLNTRSIAMRSLRGLALGML